MNFGEPEPWGAEEVQVYLARLRKELADLKLHCYFYKRVWVSTPSIKISRILFIHKYLRGT